MKTTTYKNVTRFVVTGLFAVTMVILPQVINAQETSSTIVVKEGQSLEQTINTELYRQYLLQVIVKLEQQIAILQGGAASEPLQLLFPEDGETIANNSLRVSWKGGVTNKPIDFRLLTNSANYYCEKTDAEICPQDVSVPVIELTVANDKKENFGLPRDLNGQYIVEICQSGICDYTKAPIVLE